MRRIALAFTLSLAALGAAPAFAQVDNSALSAKIDRLERDISFMQKQVYTGGSSSGSASGGTVPNGGAIEVRLTQMDQELRQIRGQIEQEQFANRQNATELKKLSEDVEYRFRALEAKAAAPVAAAPVAVAPAVTPAAAKAAAAAEAAAEEASIDGPAKFDPAAKPGDAEKKAAAAATAAAAKKPALTGNDFPDANTHYSYAFKQLNDKKYAEATSSFDGFVRKYPSDPLTPNAYYWLGESYYARADYTRSAESFRKGFEANPQGQKAPDNLFKLAKSLGQVKRTNEACIVLGQIVAKYPDSSPRIAKRAADERVTMQCK